MPDYVVMPLYILLPPTAQLEVSTSALGPWTNIIEAADLSSAGSPYWFWAGSPLTDLLLEIAANAATGRTWNLSWDATTARWSIGSTGGAAFVRLSQTLADLLGFSSTILDCTNQTQSPDLRPLAAIGGGDIVVGVAQPVEVEDAEITQYRAARASAHHYGRAMELTVDLYVHPDAWPDVEASPILSGHAFFVAVQDGDSYALWPFGPPTIERESPDDHVWIRMRCTTQEPSP